MLVLLGSLILQPSFRQVLAPGISIAVRTTLTPIPGDHTEPGLSKLSLWSGMLGDSGGAAASVGEFKEPKKAELSELLSASIAGLSDTDEGKKSRIIGERNILLKGWPGIAVTIQLESGVTESMRCFKVGDRLVQIVGSYIGDTRPAIVDKFLDSLQFDQKGTATTEEPELKSFPLGDSGMTALFPRTPEVHSSTIGRGDTQATMYTFASDYAMRSLEIGYADLSDKLPSDEDSVKRMREFMTDDTMKSLHATLKKQTESKIGDDVSLQTDFTIKDELTGSLLLYLHGKRAITFLQFGPAVYDDPATVKAFFGSLKLAPVN